MEERLALVEEIWDSVAADPASIPLPADHKAELDRRLAAHAANPDDTAPWEEVKASLEARFRQ